MVEELLNDRSNLDRLHSLSTRLELTEDKLRQEEFRFQSLVEQMPMSIQRYRPDGSVIGHNQAWVDLWQSDPDGDKDYNILEDPQVKEIGLYSTIKKAFEGEMVELPHVDYDPEKIGKKGRPRHARGYAYPVKDSSGQVVEVVLIHEDRTELKEAEMQLRYKNELYEAIMENVMDIIKVQDTDGKIKYASPSHLDALQYSPAELIGRNVREFVHPDDFHIMEGVLKIAVEGGISQIVSFRMKRKDGRWIRIEGMARGIQEGDKITTVLSIAWRSRLRQFRQQLNAEVEGDE